MASREDLEELESEEYEEEEDEGEENSNSIVDKIKKQLPFLSKLIPNKKAKSVRDDDKTDPGVAIEDEEGSSKKAGKKKPNKIIFIVVGLGLVFLFADDFLPKDEPAETPVVQTPKKKSQRELDKEKAALKAKEAAETPTETPTEAPTETPVAETEKPAEEETPVAPVETPTEAPNETISETPIEAPVETPTETPAVEEPTAPVESIGESETPMPTEESDPSIGIEEPALDLGDSTTPEGVTLSPSDNAGEDQIGMPGDTTAGGGDFTDKILQDLEKQAQDKEKTTPKKRDYVSPPDYEYTGRGLVYNCVGKHWACVDAPSYKICEQNHDSTKALNKKVECYPFNVYEKTKNCQSTQLMMTSSNAKTAFCNE